jgi:hypothetical protein
MRNRMKRIAGLTLLVGASTLVGCAWVQTPKEYAASNGYQLTNIKGEKYFCRSDQPPVPSTPVIGVDCLTRPQLSARVSALNSSHFRSDGPPFDGAAFGFQGGAIAPSSGLVSGTGMYNGNGAAR